MRTARCCTFIEQQQSMARCKQMTQVATTTEPIEAASDREQLLAKIAELEAQVQKQKEEVADSGPSIDLERILDQALARQVAEMG